MGERLGGKWEQDRDKMKQKMQNKSNKHPKNPTQFCLKLHFCGSHQWGDCQAHSPAGGMSQKNIRKNPN